MNRAFYRAAEARARGKRRRRSKRPSSMASSATKAPTAKPPVTRPPAAKPPVAASPVTTTPEISAVHSHPHSQLREPGFRANYRLDENDKEVCCKCGAEMKWYPYPDSDNSRESPTTIRLLVCKTCDQPPPDGW